MTVVALDTRRRVTLGGFDAGAVCGVDQFESPIAVWHRLTTGAEREQTEAMRLGNLLEPLVREEAERGGYPMMPAPADGFADPERSWLRGHPDGFTSVSVGTGPLKSDALARGAILEPSPSAHPAIFEAKTGGLWLHHWFDTELHAPPSHVLQVQTYMHLLGYPLAVIGYLVAGQSFRFVHVPRDDALIARMLDRMERFMALVRRNVPPEPLGTDSDRETLRAMFPAATETSVRFTGETWQTLKHARRCKERRDYAEREYDAAVQTLQLAMGEATDAFSPYDEPCARWSNVTQRRFDSAAFKSDNPAAYERYRLPTQTRRFSLL